jgi:lipopolysaccharide export LptBFGC system permease protein LptF
MFFAFYGIEILCMVLAYRGWLHHIPAAIAPAAIFLTLGVIAFRRAR